jgi:beta-lactamase regulating signal transducer with metallopeptidase domain/predicted  nucleic acid-binding Zn-ribbon protein
MNPLLQSLIPSLAWALLDFVWQGLLVGWAAALALNLLRSARPQTRYAIACAALLLCAALPISGVVMRMQDRQPQTGTALAPIITTMQGAHDAQARQGGVAEAPSLQVDQQLGAWQAALQSRLPLVVLIWSCGAGLLALRLLLGLLWVRRLSNRAGRPTDQAWQTRLQDMARRLGITRPVRLGLVDEVPGPVTAGWWRPVVVLPAALITRMPPELLEALLAHELAHIKRHDYLVNLIQSGIEIVLFYHPTVWWLSNRIRVEREQIADDLAASMLGEPRRLALALTELDQFQFTTPRLAHAAHGGHLMSRIKRLIRPDTEPLSWKMAVPILGLCAAGAAFYAHADTAPAVAPSIVAPAIAAPIVAVSLAAIADVPVPPVAPAPPAEPAPPAAPMDKAVPPVPPAPKMYAGVPPVPPVPPAAPLPSLKPLKPLKPMKPMSGMYSSNFEGDLTIRDSKQESYAVVRGTNSINMSGRSRDLRELETIKRVAGDHFLWFRNEGKAYIVQDATVMAKIDQAWAPVDKLGKQMDVYGKEMDEHGKVMDALGKEMDVAGRQFETSVVRKEAEKMSPVAREQKELGKQISKVERKRDRAKNDAERDAADRELAPLEAKMGALEKQMDALEHAMEAEHAKMEKAHGPMEAIGKKMEQAGKPMEALGKKMEVLGKEMEKESQAADKVVRGLIQDALKSGLAKPAPDSSKTSG